MLRGRGAVDGNGMCIHALAIAEADESCRDLTRQGNDAGDAEDLLVQFEAAKEILNTDRDRLRRLVANIESDWPQSA